MFWIKIHFYRLFMACLAIATFFVSLTACSPGSMTETKSAKLTSQQPEIPANLPPPATLRYAVFPAPPYMIGASSEQDIMSGIDVEIVQEIARHMELKLEFVRCPWVRCLELMQNGDVDILSSAYKKPEREAYMLYFDQPYLDQLPIAFYSLKSRKYDIQKYEDLYHFNQVGVLKGASYFKQFDQDTRIKKFEVASQDQLFPMLAAGHLEIMAGYVPTENYRIHVEGYEGVIERSIYEYNEQALVYMTISKKSPLAAYYTKLNLINNQLYKEGFINRVINGYYEKYR